MEEEKQKNRHGNTVVTSVSVSKEMHDIMIHHNFSPTEIFRRGLAVMLYDAGDVHYNTEKNKLRSEYVEKFIKKLDEDQKIKEQAEKIIELGLILKGLKSDEK